MRIPGVVRSALALFSAMTAVLGGMVFEAPGVAAESSLAMAPAFPNGGQPASR